jgi:hypothetical protein
VSGTGESYECTLCHETFVKTISDEEAMAESGLRAVLGNINDLKARMADRQQAGQG